MLGMEQDMTSISWKDLPWKKFQVKSFRLQRKIYKAKTCLNLKEFKRLKKLLTQSKSIYYILIQNVSQQYGHKGLFLSSKMKLTLVYETFYKFKKSSYLQNTLFVENFSLSIRILKRNILYYLYRISVLEFNVKFLFNSMSCSILKRLTNLLNSRVKANEVLYFNRVLDIKEPSFLKSIKLLHLGHRNLVYKCLTQCFRRLYLGQKDFKKVLFLLHGNSLSERKSIELFWKWKAFRDISLIFSQVWIYYLNNLFKKYSLFTVRHIFEQLMLDCISNTLDTEKSFVKPKYMVRFSYQTMTFSFSWFGGEHSKFTKKSLDIL